VKLQLAPEHMAVTLSNDCWIIAIATLLGISYYEAHALMLGGPPIGDPDGDGHISKKLEEVEPRLFELGFARARFDYQNAKTPRLVIGAHRSSVRDRQTRCFRYWNTLHAVVWNPETKQRVDPCERDTFKLYNSRTVRVYRFKGCSITTGVTTGLQRPALDAMAFRAELVERIHRATQEAIEAQAKAMVDRALDLAM